MGFIGVFPKWRRTFAEFSEFRITDKSLKHELGSILRSCLSHVSCWHCGSMLVSYTRGGSVAFFVTEFTEFSEKHLGNIPLNLVKTFRKNPIDCDEAAIRNCPVTIKVLISCVFSIRLSRYESRCNSLLQKHRKQSKSN